MDQVQPWQLLTALCVVGFIGLMLLLWGDRPDLAAAIRRLFEERPARDITSSGGWDAPEPPDEPPEPMPVRAQTHQTEPNEPAENEPAPEPSLHKLGRTALIALLSMQKDDDGRYVYSANKITEFVGGTAAEVKAQIAELRKKEEPPTPPVTGPTPRPVNGW